jgi:magnesium transporter
MINIWKNSSSGLKPISEIDTGCWVDARNVTKEELVSLGNEHGILSDHLQDIMDTDEQARIEKEEGYTMLVIRLPVYDSRYEVPYYTVPLGVILKSDIIITICQTDSDVLTDLTNNRIRDLSLKNKSAFVLQLLGRAAIIYLRQLKDINRRTTVIERELQRSVKNNELVQLLSLQKSLVFFTTSLKQNEILLEKLQISKLMRFRDEESELLEDVLTDNKQAIEMSNIYSSILTGTMDAFASVISNNLNLVMRRLTIISIVLMIPTLIVSYFGMNVEIPFVHQKFGFILIFFFSLFAALFGAFLLRDRKPKKRRSPNLAAHLSNAVALDSGSVTKK